MREKMIITVYKTEIFHNTWRKLNNDKYATQNRNEIYKIMDECDKMINFWDKMIMSAA